MRDFDFLQPATVLEASRMLGELGDECRAMAGGTALMLALRQRMVTPTHIVSLAKLEELRGISFDAITGLRIGALCRHNEIAQSPIVQQHYPMLAAMAAQVANPQVRNQGTIGGNLCYADPATDPPGCLMALGARVSLQSRQGERELSVEQFMVDYFTTAIAPDEVLTGILIHPPVADAVGLYSRFLRTAAEHRPLVSIALCVRKSGLLCHEARLVVGASVVVPARLNGAEAMLNGQRITRELASQVANQAAQSIEPIDDLRGSAAFRRNMVRVVTTRSLIQLFGLAESP